jgi:hypothetical protein
VNDKLFHLQQDIALHLIALLENKKVSIKRAAEIADRVLNIVPENSQNLNFAEIVRQLHEVSELKSLEFNQEE